MIPSWYPQITDPLSGSFFKEQAAWFVKYQADAHLLVSAAHLLSVTPRKPLTSTKNLYTAARSLARTETSFLGRLVEEHATFGTWNRKILNGNNEGILKFHRENFQRAEQMFGRIDLIHAHSCMPGGHFARLLSREFNVPYAITEHMGPFPFKQHVWANGALDPWLTRAIREADLTIAVSPFLASEMVARGFDRPIVVPNSVDTEFFSPECPESARPGRTMLSINRFVSKKGWEDLLQALAHCVKETPELRCRIGGFGPLEPTLRDMARVLGLDNNLTWLGKLNRDQVRDEIRACDFLVNPSHLESFSVICVEAIACGKPVVATKCGGPESIITGNTGLLVPIKSPDQLAEAIKSMCLNLNRYRSEVIRQECLDKYSAPSVASKLWKVFEATCANKSSDIATL
jgi:glycosyltransferase involved in cell wall biosynthesis